MPRKTGSDQPATSVAIAPCRHCGQDTVWLKTAYGAWGLFEAAMFPTTESYHGNRFAIDRRSRQVVDLDNFGEKRWPAECLHLHRHSCPQGYDEARFRAHRPRQAGYVDQHADLDDTWDFHTRLGRTRRRDTA
jgi:hypothetical protein